MLSVFSNLTNYLPTWSSAWTISKTMSRPDNQEEPTPGHKLAIHLDYLYRFSKRGLTDTVTSLLNEDINLFLSEDSLEMILTGVARANTVDFVPVWRQFCERIRAEAADVASVTNVSSVSSVSDGSDVEIDVHTVLLPIPPGYRAALTKQLAQRLFEIGHRYAINYLDLPNADNCLVMLDLAVAATGVSSILQLYSTPEDYINLMVKNQPGHVAKLLSSYDFSSHEAQFRAKYGFSSLMVAIWLFNQQQLHDASLYSYMMGARVALDSAKVSCCDIICSLMRYTTRLNWGLVSDLVDSCRIVSITRENASHGQTIIQQLLKHALAANIDNPKTFLAVLQYISRDVEPDMSPEPFFTDLAVYLVRNGAAVTNFGNNVSPSGSSEPPVDEKVFDLSNYFIRSRQDSIRFKNDLANGFYDLRHFTGSLDSKVKPAAVKPNQSDPVASALDILQRHYQVDLAQIQPILAELRT